MGSLKRKLKRKMEKLADDKRIYMDDDIIAAIDRLNDRVNERMNEAARNPEEFRKTITEPK